MEVDLCPNLIRAPNSDQLRCTVIGFFGIIQALVWLKSWTCTYAFISDEFATESLTQPYSYSKKQQLNCGTNYTENFDRDVHRDLNITSYWDFVEESRLSCMSTISLDHTDDTTFTASPTRTHIPKPELRNSEQYLMEVLCQWNVVLCLEYRALEVVDWCIDVGEWMLFGQVSYCLSNSRDWPNSSIYCLWSSISKNDDIVTPI